MSKPVSPVELFFKYELSVARGKPDDARQAALELRRLGYFVRSVPPRSINSNDDDLMPPTPPALLA